MTAPMLPPIRRKALGDLLLARLKTIVGDPTITVYRGEVPKPGDIPRTPDSDRVAPYVVLFDAGGPTDLEPGLCGQNEDMAWRPQLTIAAGFSPDCAQTVDRVCEQIYRWSPVISGLACGPLVPLPGFDPGSIRRDDTVSPPRFFLATQWQLIATT